MASGALSLAVCGFEHSRSRANSDQTGELGPCPIGTSLSEIAKSSCRAPKNLTLKIITLAEVAL